MTDEPNIMLTGELLIKGKDWNLTEFGSLFERLLALYSATSSVTRLVQYHGVTSTGTAVRFFGVQVPSIDGIPDGMVSLSMDRNTLTVYTPLDTFNNVIWKSDLEWKWLDMSATNCPIGEFTTTIPREWVNGGNDTVRFVVTANTWSVKDSDKDDTVQLAAYDPIWPKRFELMKQWLSRNIPSDIVLRIEHYGSTAIPGMTAKPVIDILVEISSFDTARKTLLPLFNRPEYEYWWYDDHMLFIVRDRQTGIRTHHIHAAPAGHQQWEGLAFRNHLRTRPDDARQYEELKRRLVENHAADRETYTEMKESFVRAITDKALKRQ